jgi:hypothetical protein
MRNITGSLIAQKNDSIYLYMIKTLVNYKKTCNSLSYAEAPSTLVHAHPSNVLNNLSPQNAKSFCERIALTYFYKAFVQECWTHTQSFQGGKTLHKMTHCPPIGFKSMKGCFPCEHPMCPNCYMRKAASYYESLKTLNPENPAIVITLKTPFVEEIYGYNTPDMAGCSRVKMLKKIMQPQGEKSLAMAGGVYVDGDQHPFVLTNYHVIVKPEDVERKIEAANYFLQKICETESKIKTEGSVKSDLKVGYLTAAMYNACPLKLISTSAVGFSDLCLIWTINEFFEFNFNKKTHKFIKL